MIAVKIDTSGLLTLAAQVGGMADKQVAFATSRALNAAAYAAQRATADEIAKVFDRPTDWVRRSVRYTKASKTNLRSVVDFDAWGNKQGVTASHVLRAEIDGGPRKNKRSEVALQRAGILPRGMAIVPGPAAKLDAYGNMSAGQINQILSWFRAFGEQGYSSNMRDGGRRLGRGKKNGARGFAYFALTKNHGSLIPGVYQRFAFAAPGERKASTTVSAVKPVMFFVRMPNYKRRLGFYGLAERVARAEFDKRFPEMLDQAMRTAK